MSAAFHIIRHVAAKLSPTPYTNCNKWTHLLSLIRSFVNKILQEHDQQNRYVSPSTVFSFSMPERQVANIKEGVLSLYLLYAVTILYFGSTFFTHDVYHCTKILYANTRLSSWSALANTLSKNPTSQEPIRAQQLVGLAVIAASQSDARCFVRTPPQTARQ